MSLEEAAKRDWDGFDIILITGDAYIDHPAFGTAIIGRVLEAKGYRVGIISQPNWRDDLRDFRKLGTPALFFGVTAGNMDSMVNHYSAGKRLRSDDAYTAGGKAGFRPDYATVVYSRILKNLFPEIPVVAGGIEASMRRAAHYDYWSDSVKPSMIYESGADLLVYGMADQVIGKMADFFKAGGNCADRINLPQCGFIASADEVANIQSVCTNKVISSFEECADNKSAYAEAFRIIEKESNKADPEVIIQPTAGQFVVITPPEKTPSTDSLDAVYDLPYTRLPHPRYRKRGEIPAWKMIRHSVTIHRGCFGGCSFCTISMHQGKWIASRSEQSILNEVTRISRMEDFRGVISDLGGPSANMYRMEGSKKEQCARCNRPSCIWPSICKNLDFNHKHLIKLYQKVQAKPGIRKVFIGSGIRYDMLTGHPGEVTGKYHLREYTRQLISHHVSGRLKVAPEHSDPDVLNLIRKPPFSSYLSFRKDFMDISRDSGLRQQLIPYLISSLPGSDHKAMGKLACDLASAGQRPEQVQDFTPTPMTLSTTMYYSGINPYDHRPVHIVKSENERKEQKMFLLWYKDENRRKITEIMKANNQSHLLRKLYYK